MKQVLVNPKVKGDVVVDNSRSKEAADIVITIRSISKDRKNVTARLEGAKLEAIVDFKKFEVAAMLKLIDSLLKSVKYEDAVVRQGIGEVVCGRQELLDVLRNRFGETH